MTFAVRFLGMGTAAAALNKFGQTIIQQLADDIYTEVRNTTPVDTGTAQKGWKKKMLKTRFVIDNNVPYVEVLDKGRHMTSKGMRGSKQAPKGIVGPSLEKIKGRN
jgi:hypothetical protein